MMEMSSEDKHIHRIVDEATRPLIERIKRLEDNERLRSCNSGVRIDPMTGRPSLAIDDQAMSR